MKNTPPQGIIIVALLVAGFATCSFGQFQLPPIALPLMETFSLNHAQFSSVFSAAMIPAILFSLVSGLLADRIGLRRVVIFGGLLTALGFVLRMFSTGYTSLLMTMILSGCLAAFLNANVAKIAQAWFRDKAALIVGIVMAGGSFGQTIAFVITPAFPSITSLFIATAILSAIVALLLFFFMQDHPGNGDAHTPTVALGDSLKIALSTGKVWLIGIALGMIIVYTIVFTGSLPSALQSLKNFTPHTASLVSASIPLGVLFGTIIGPIIYAKMKSLALYSTIFGSLAALFGIFGWLPTSSVVIFICYLLGGLFLGGLMPIYLALPPQLPQIGQAYAGTAGGLVSTLQLLCGVIIPSYILVPLTGANYQLLFTIGGASIMVLVILSYLIQSKSPAQI